ncbi:MAG: hypothetical protein ABSE69_15505 [Roseiarcus sp.]|jgi:hypothetical protein
MQYVVKLSASDGKVLNVDLNLPLLNNSAQPDNADCNWTTETTGVISINSGRCGIYGQPGTDSHYGVADLVLSAPSATNSDYGTGVTLSEFVSATGFFNASGNGTLDSSFYVAGGMTAGPIFWVKIS